VDEPRLAVLAEQDVGTLERQDAPRRGGELAQDVHGVVVVVLAHRPREVLEDGRQCRVVSHVPRVPPFAPRPSQRASPR
jgi:hypothetical protein